MESSMVSSSAAYRGPAGIALPVASMEPSTSSVDDTEVESMFIKHQVSKLDTLAGLAIRYNVSVGDIKRANGLLSDNALYARSTILVPRGRLPIGEELQRICAKVLTGVSRDPVLHADAQSQPASAAVARIATTLNVINGESYPEDLPVSECAWIAMGQCGGCGPMDPSGFYLRSLQPVEVELTDRSSSEGTYLPPTSAGPTRQDAAAVRRRRNQNDDAGSCSDSANSYGWGAQRQNSCSEAGGKATGGSSDNGRFASWFSELGKAIGEGVSSTVAKVKEAASQPALARPSPVAGGGFGAAAADAIVASRRKATGALLGRAPFEGAIASAGLHGTPTSAGGASRAKQGGKMD
ncbi:hypothetical protein Agub_g12643 [Astrephomene gubernaculifera]|uniref:LysM domain-containing protein n=1 Tax=Astrephomene gubernaculifera TaxID=47775 RepID=A0AAD3E0J5_9CHLO|nr:hypothetical protein Agub_g12643 [Astrephomene gubernaculifera]